MWNKHNRFPVIMLIISMLFIISSCALYRLIPKTVTVLASADSTASGIVINTGDNVTFAATGEVVFTQLEGIEPAGPAGSTDIGTPNEADPDGAISYPMPDELMAALIGRIGANGEPFLIGSTLDFTAESTGELYLLINDNYPDNNSGSFEVTVIFEDSWFEL